MLDTLSYFRGLEDLVDRTLPRVINVFVFVRAGFTHARRGIVIGQGGMLH